MVAFVSSFVVLLLGVGVVFLYGRRRRPDAPLSWGEAFVAGTFVFFLLFWAYGVVPHQWLTWADNELNWRQDEFFYEGYAIDVTKQAIRDIIAVLIYVAFLGGQIFLWVWWQKRADSARPKEVAPSPYGRPLLRPEAEA